MTITKHRLLGLVIVVSFKRLNHSILNINVANLKSIIITNLCIYIFRLDKQLIY